jgi:2-dehydropantoate 2-reductase
MEDLTIAVVGIGATGSVLAAALLGEQPDTILVEPRSDVREALVQDGLEISGVVSYQVPAHRVVAGITDLRDMSPDVVFVNTKTSSLPQVLDGLSGVFRPGMKIVSAQNGLGTEDLIAERFGSEAALRMTLNYGASILEPGRVETTFFNRPNYLGAVADESREAGEGLSAALTGGGLDTQYVGDVKPYVWKKMLIKCTMASICAVTDRTIKDALDFPPTREIADACFQEFLAVAEAMGYPLGQETLAQGLAYLEKVGGHKDSMCYDIAKKLPTEIDFLGGKVVEYAREKGVPVPFYTVMTDLVRALEDSYLRG